MKKLLKYGVASLSLVALNLAAMAVSADTAGVEPPVVVEDTTSLTNSAVPASSALVEGVTASADTATTGADSQTDAAVELSQWTIAVDLADGTSHVVPIPKAGILPIHVPGIGEAEIWLPTGWADTDTAPENVSLVHYTSDADTPRLVLSRHGGGLPQEDGRFLRFYSLTTRHDPKLASEQPAIITVSGDNGASNGQEQSSVVDATVTQFTQPTTTHPVSVSISPADSGKVAGIQAHAVTDTATLSKLPDTIKGENVSLYDIKTVSDKGEFIQITAPAKVTLVIDSTRTVEKVIYFLPATGAVEELPFTLSEDGLSVSFYVTHFSQYGVVYTSENQGVEVQQAPTSPISVNTDQVATTRNQLLAQVDKSSLTDDQKGELAVKITFAETAEELDKIKAELTRLTVPAAKPASVDTPAETSTKTLPATGDSPTETLVAMGLTLLLASLGLSKIRKTV